MYRVLGCVLEARHTPGYGRARRVLGVLATTLLALSSCSEIGGRDLFEVAPDTPIVIVLIDTLRADHLSCYGYPLETSPFLDELASRSYLFESNSTQCNATFPSITSIFTGVYPKTHRNYLAVPVEGTVGGDERITCAAQDFKNQGYFTAAVTSHPSWGANRDRNAALWRGWDVISHLGDPIPIQDRPLFARSEYTNERLFELLDAYEREHSNKPLFLWAHYFDPHTDIWGNLYDPPQDVCNAYFDHHFEDLEVESFADILRPLDPAARNEWIHSNGPKLLRSTLKLACGRSGYDAEILSCDRGIRELFDRLKQGGLLDEAVIVVMSDHGENMEAHTEARDAYPFTHGRLYEGVSHTPLMIHLPGQKVGHRIDSITQNIDVLPTLMELLDLPRKTQFEGKSLVPLMRGDTASLHDLVYMEASAGAEKGVRSENLKLTDGWKPEEREVYAWRNDPEEKYNLSLSFSEKSPAELIGALKQFRPEVRLCIRCVPMKEPYDVEIQSIMPGVQIEFVEGVPESTISEDGSSFSWTGTIGPEGKDILLKPKVYKSSQEVRWKIRHTGREDLHRAVRIGRTSVCETTAIPLWQLEKVAVPSNAQYSVTMAGTLLIEIDHPGAKRIECEVRYALPRHDKVFEVKRSEGFAERYPHNSRFHQADALDAEHVLLELGLSHPGAAIYYLLRIDGVWPDAERLMINNKAIDTDTLHFLFPAFPKDKRIQPYLNAGPLPDRALPPGSIIIWQESGGDGGEIDVGRLSPDLAKQLDSIGYLGQDGSDKPESKSER